MVIWCNTRYVIDMKDAELDKFAAMGIRGFVMQTNDLAPGGGQFFTLVNGQIPPPPPPGPDGKPRADRNLIQRSIRDTDIVNRCKARGIDLWLGFYLAQGTNHQTPLVPWADPDTAWQPFLNAITALATFAKQHGFVGLALDEEMYRGGTWEWNYPGNTRTEADIRGATRMRGSQVMGAINAGYPGADLITYGWLITDSWNGLRVQTDRPAFKTMVNIDFWKGMTAIAGFSALRFWDATFYRGTQASGTAGTWDVALPEAKRLLRDGFTRSFPNWATISPKIFAEPFAWIDGIPGGTGFNAARTAADAQKVAEQLTKMARYTEGDVVGIYSWGRPNTDFYAPFAPGILGASKI